MFEAPDIPGAADVISWFGYWPTFHDGEVLSITLNRSGESRVVIHAFVTRENDVKGNFVFDKHAVITFHLDGFPRDQRGLTNVSIGSFDHQNQLSSARVEKLPEGYELILEDCNGGDTRIVVKHMSVTLNPGMPDDSM